MIYRNDATDTTCTNSVGGGSSRSAGLQRTTDGRPRPSQHRRRGGRRPGGGPAGRGGGSAVESSLTTLPTETEIETDAAGGTAVSYEASPNLLFEELASLIDLSESDDDSDDNGDDPAGPPNRPTTDAEVAEAFGLVFDRVHGRLLDKHLKTGRLVASRTAVQVGGGDVSVDESFSDAV